jgi:hypothetical protein
LTFANLLQADLEKEITALKIKLDAHQVNHQERETEVKEWKTRAESEKGRFDKVGSDTCPSGRILVLTTCADSDSTPISRAGTRGDQG